MTLKQFMDKTRETGVRVLGKGGLEKMALVAGLSAGTASGDVIWNAEGTVGLQPYTDSNSGLMGVAVYVDNKTGDSVDSAQIVADFMEPAYNKLVEKGAFTGSLGDFMNSTVSYGFSDSSEVQNGWNSLLDSQGNLSLTHVDGRLGRSYDVFNDINADPAGNTVVHNYLWDQDVNGNGQVDNYEGFRVVQGDNFTAATLNEGGVNGLVSDLTSNNYVAAVPEATTMSLIGVVAVGTLLARRLGAFSKKAA